MSGYTLTMAPALDTSFHKSVSDPELTTLGPIEQCRDRTPWTQQREGSNKSFSSLPGLDLPSFDSDFELDTSIFKGGRPSSPVRPATSAEDSEKQTRFSMMRSKTNSLIDRRRSWFPTAKTTSALLDEDLGRPKTSFGESDTAGWSARLSDLRPLERGLAVSDSFANFAKRSWIGTSRSPSPKARPQSPRDVSPTRVLPERSSSVKVGLAGKRLGLGSTGPEHKKSSDSLKPAPKAFTRASTYFAKIKPKQPLNLTKLSTSNAPDSDNSCASSDASLAPPVATSIDTRFSQSNSCDSNTTNTDESSSDIAPRMRDVLWSSFKALDLEYKAFISKQTGPRIVQLQQTVLPFLRNTASDTSLHHLRPEGIERRATILGKWWLAALDMLEGQPMQQPVAGVDRPVLLETAAMIMMRPEWRWTTAYFRPLEDRPPEERFGARTRSESSASSIVSSEDDFLEESAEHNVRTAFTSNLLRQMAFVVDKMCLRHAPVTFVDFSGKTCAYAFFFAPGVADILVRLWALGPDLIRRIGEELKLPRKSYRESDDIVALFPPHLGSLGWTSPRAMWDTLKKTPQMTILVAKIAWTGPWVMRWKGRDTDLLYNFTKYFHVLSDQFMPVGLPLVEKARSPAFALVHAQLLTILDSTIHRQPSATQAMGQIPLMDSVRGVDASAMAMPLPPTNLMKGMSENRLVALVKDFLAENHTESPGARHTFAEAFTAVMKASTVRTSQFNSIACFTMCDFMEEALPTLIGFETSEGKVDIIDWQFWMDVWKKMLGSLNTMTEIRILAFLFAMWDVVANDQARKSSLCLDWLLKEEVFDSFFNNWCPMVRAYYHRLYCWRICRDEGSANELDMKIFLVAASRLKTVWAHYLFMKHNAEDEGRIPPSTAPMHPTPGKKFMIIRQEVQTPQPGLFTSFDSLARNSGNDPLSMNALAEAGLLAKGDSKKRWSLLGKALSFTGMVGAQYDSDFSRGNSKRLSWEDNLDSARHETAAARSRPAMAVPPPPPPKTATSENTDFDSTCSSPTIEEQKFVFRFYLGWQQPAMPPRERVLNRPRLPAPAQSWVSMRAQSGESPPPPGVPSPARVRSREELVGLIQGAKNASEMSSPMDLTPKRLSLNLQDLESELSGDLLSSVKRVDSNRSADGTATPATVLRDEPKERVLESITKPVKPTGMYVKNAVYSGRALAEWGQVIFECNAFIDRRREEGILGLSEVEVPILGVEGFRRPGL